MEYAIGCHIMCHIFFFASCPKQLNTIGDNLNLKLIISMQIFYSEKKIKKKMKGGRSKKNILS